MPKRGRSDSATPAAKRARRDAALTKLAAIVGAPAPVRRRRRASMNMRTGGFLGIENKFVDLNFSGDLGVSVTGSECDPATVLALNAIAQGDGESERDGRVCRLRSVHVKGLLTKDSSSTAPSTFVRLLLVLDTQTNGAQLNAEDVIVSASSTITFRNLQYAKRFRVLRDQLYTLNSQSGVATAFGGANKTFEWNVPLNNLVCTHSGTTASVANIQDNSLHVIAIGSNAADVALAYRSRVRFVG